MPVQNSVKALGYAGLIPFVLPAAVVIANSGHSDLAIVAIEAYAFGIICFLTGSWWGMAFRAGQQIVVILSNVYFVIAFLVLLFAPTWWSLTAAMLLIGIFILEQNRNLFASFPDYYRNMRATLTLVASGSMTLIHFAR